MLMPRKPEAIRPLTGEEVLYLMQDGKIRRTSPAALNDVIKQVVAQARRVEEINATTGTPFTFTKAFTNVPLFIPIGTWSGDQKVDPYVTSISTTSITLLAKRTRSTLLLSSGPYQDAPAGTPVKGILIEP